MKFTIRDLFLVTVIVALGLGWWVERRQSIDAQAHEKAFKVVSLKIESHLRSELATYRELTRQQAERLSGESLPTSQAPALIPPNP